MKKRFVYKPVFRCIHEVPELVGEIPKLFLKAGTAKVVRVGMSPHLVSVQIQLSKPVSIITKRPANDSFLSINPDTLALVGYHGGLSLRLASYPKNGDTTVTLHISLEWHSASESQFNVMKDMRTELRRLSEDLNMVWYCPKK